MNIGSQEITGLKGKFGLGVQNEAGQKPTEFYQENLLVIAKTPFPNNARYDSTNGHYQMVNTKTRLIIFFAMETVRDFIFLILQNHGRW